MQERSGVRRAGDPGRRPPGADDATVAAVGKLTEALEWVERARGHLYELHQEIGHAEATLLGAIDALGGAGHRELAAEVARALVGLDVLEGRWTFEIVEEFDDGYYDAYRRAERHVREELLAGRRHVFESELKASEQGRRQDP